MRAVDAGVGADRPPDLDRVRAFVWAVLVALREGHLRDGLQAAGRRARVYQVRLTADEGGMNLHMSRAEACTLMDYGRRLAAHILKAEGLGP